MSNLKIRMVAYTGAAGKYDPAAPMCGNEDNFYVDDNLRDNIPGHCNADEVIDMDDCGIIMAVCDGMGGMNAGEVASAIAVQTIQDYFAPNKINLDLALDPKARKSYLERLVAEADKRIKDDAKRNKDHEGMGSTIILAWMVGSDLTVTWCGDSRAYRFNPATGLSMLSEDHSYVQELVNKGVLTYDDTFEHPQGNIITRSLGDPSKKAKPETREFKLYEGDIILLCSDGLNGVLRDRKTLDSEGNYYPGDNIEDIIRTNTSSMVQCRNELWEAAKRADWYDNVTILLCQIVNGTPVTKEEIDNYQKSISVKPEVPDSINKTVETFDDKKKQDVSWNKTLHLNLKFKPKTLLLTLLGAILIVCGLFYFCSRQKETNMSGNGETDYSVKQDSLIHLIQEQKEFFELSGLNYEASCFEDILNKISLVNDSTSLIRISDEVNNLIKTLKDKVIQLKHLDKLIFSEDTDEAVVDKLKKLRATCIEQDLSLDEIKRRANDIIHGKTTETRTISPTPTPIESLPPTQPDQPRELTPVPSIELTPVYKSETFIMLPTPDNYAQIEGLKNKYAKEGFKFDGIYKDGKKVEAENYKAEEEYEIRFVKQ